MSLPVITAAQMRQWEQATWASGQTESTVIEQVGREVARQALQLTNPGDSILFLAGKGHNGDDARAASPYLTDRQVDLLNVTAPEADLPRLDLLLARPPALVIDGLFGIGLDRPLSAEWCAFIERVNRSARPVLAIDVPSGLAADTGQPLGAALRATVTLTVGAPKRGLLAETSWPWTGKLLVADQVGLLPCPLAPTELHWTIPQDFDGFPPVRPVATHKGTYGHLAVIAGSLGYHGAAVLAARAAQRAQPGLITLLTLEAVYAPVAAQLQAVMVAPWRPPSVLPATTTAILAGPGLASAEVPEPLRDEVRQLWRHSPLPMVVDASALEWLPAESAPARSLRVITPHPGEAGRLLGIPTSQVQADRLAALRATAKRCSGAWVVLKGHQTLVGAAAGPVYCNPSGNPHLAQGGSGDVLAGFLGGLLAQPALQANPLQSLRYAIWQHGAAADRLQASRRNWVVEDLLGELGNQDTRAAAALFLFSKPG